MEPVANSNYYLPNKIGLITLQSLEGVMGTKGVNAILNLAHLKDLINQPPSDTLQKEFDFSQVSAINQALEEIYGVRYGQNLALRAGKASFDEVLKDIGPFGGMKDPVYLAMQPQIKLKIGLIAMSRVFAQISDLVSTLEENTGEFIFTVQRCPACWQRHGLGMAVCSTIVGQLQAALKWASGGIDFPVNETHCIAMGDPNCEFAIKKTPKT